MGAGAPPGRPYFALRPKAPQRHGNQILGWVVLLFVALGPLAQKLGNVNGKLQGGSENNSKKSCFPFWGTQNCCKSFTSSFGVCPFRHCSPHFQSRETGYPSPRDTTAPLPPPIKHSYGAVLPEKGVGGRCHTMPFLTVIK